jgi:hypothetical protein
MWEERWVSCGQLTHLWITQEALAVVPEDVELVDAVDELLVEDDVDDEDELSDDFDSDDFDSDVGDADGFLPSALLSVR